MTRSSVLRLALLSLAASVLAAPAWARLPYPDAKVQVVADTLHGTVIEDPYRWLEAKDAPETRAWIDAENALTSATLGKLPGREPIVQRLGQLLNVEVRSVPTEQGGRYFFSKRVPGQEQRVLVMRQGADGKDEVLVDPNSLSPDHTTSVSYLDVSSDGARAAIGTRQGGQDEVSVSFLDVATHRELPDRLAKGRYFGVSLRPDGKGVFYAHYDHSGSRIFEHTFGQDPAQDRLVFGDGRGPEQIITDELSEDGRWLLITVYYGSAADKTELWVQDVAGGGPLTPIVNDVQARFVGNLGGDQLFVNTNWKAPNGRILAVDLKHPERAAWKEIVPEGPNAIEAMTLAGGRVFVTTLENVNSSVRVFDPQGKALGRIQFPTLGSIKELTGRWSSNDLRFTFTSFHVPATIYRYDTATAKRSEWWRSPAAVNSDALTTEQVWYRSKDGTKVPMFLVHKKGLKADGNRPIYLTGYGGFTVSNTPAFDPTAVLWAEAGGVYALPNLRGGSEFGESWHKAGMLANKQNVFDDFTGAAEWLIANHWSNPKTMAIEGGSNGGLLVGAAFTQHPELFQAVICDVPLLDMLRYQNFLVARFWVPEYGSSEDAEQFKFLRAYSPYQHVTKGVDYPAILFVTGDSDTRVDPLHARKMTALMQASTGGERPILLHYDTKLGHAGGKPVSKQIEDSADEIQFLFWQLGVGAPGGVTATATGANAR